MKPIGGIVANKKSNADSFRQVETFTTELLSKLWKVYTVNKDVVDRGRRLENLFWRLWSSERINRLFTGKTVSDIFMQIHADDELFYPCPHRESRINSDAKNMPERGQLAGPPKKVDSSPRPSVEIKCPPPTPPPSPVPNSLERDHSFLSKEPEHTEITASLQQVLPLPPSPPGPSSSLPIAQDHLPSPPAPSAPHNNGAPQKKIRPSPSPRQLNPATLSTVSEDASEWVSPSSVRSETSTASRTSSTASTTGRKLTTSRTDQLRKGKRKKIILPNQRRRGIPPAPKSQLAQNKSASSPTSNPAQNPSQTTSSHRTAPPERPPNRRQKSTQSEPELLGRRTASSGGGWIVDPDFRTKYIERKQQAVVRAAPATVRLVEEVATARTRREKKGLVVEDVGGIEAAPADNGGKGKGLVRGKSQLTLLFEEAKKDR